MKKIMTRRDFIKGSTCAILGTTVGFSTQIEKKSRIILIRHSDAVDQNSVVNGDIIQKMLDEAVSVLLDAKDAAEAYSKLVKPGEVVGIKSNVWSYLPTPPEVENAIKSRLIEAGIPIDNIGIDDHNVKTNPIFLKATSLFNARPLRTHYLAGVSGCIKNYIMFAPSQPALHPNSCADLGSVFKLPIVKGKTRLNVLCALTPQFHGRGPHHFNRRYIWSYKGLIVGQDPVAVDAVGLKLIMAKRSEVLGRDKALPPVPKHIEVADKKHGIGNSDFNKIELIKLGWDEDILI